MKSNIELLFLGDSLTARANWNKLLQKENIVNLGIDGDTTLGILKRLDEVIKLNPKYVLLMVGVNDLCLYSSNPNEVYKNYVKVVEKLSSYKIEVILQSTLFTQMPTVNKKILTFNNLLKSYCEKQNYSFINLNPLLCQNGILKERYSTDGLHLNTSAYDVWSNEIKTNPYILSTYESEFQSI